MAARTLALPSRRATAVLPILVAAITLAGCGTALVKPATYVRSVCVALGNWRNTIDSAGVALQSSGASSAPRAAAKLDYERFVSSLVIATARATRALRAAGAPSVANGRQIAKRLERAFERATSGLAKARSEAGAIPTDSASAFQLGAGAVSSQIRSAVQQIAHVSPGQSPELQSAAARVAACQVLAG